MAEILCQEIHARRAEEPATPLILLQGAVSAAGAATIIAASPSFAVAASKMSQKAVNYQDHLDGDKRCDKCVQFQPPNACKVVDGTISPQGSCRIFAPIRQAVRRSIAIPSTPEQSTCCRVAIS